MRLLIGRQGVADLGDGADEIVPADLFAQIVAVPQGILLKRAARRERQKQRAYEYGNKGEASEIDGGDGDAAPAG